MEDVWNSSLEQYVLLSKEQCNVMSRPDGDQMNPSDSYGALLMADQPANSSAGELQLDQCLAEQESGQPKAGNESSLIESQQYREQDLYLPITNISRIMKKCLPENGKTSKTSKTTMQECVSEFISFVTSEAAETVRAERRQTLNGDDLINAMARLGFQTSSSNYIDPLKVYLKKYRQMNSVSTACPDSNDSAECSEQPAD